MCYKGKARERSSWRAEDKGTGVRRRRGPIRRREEGSPAQSRMVRPGEVSRQNGYGAVTTFAEGEGTREKRGWSIKRALGAGEMGGRAVDEGSLADRAGDDQCGGGASQQRAKCAIVYLLSTSASPLETTGKHFGV